ncbi:MAG: DNA primase, partial [Armatimonadetes bacterium]|nr:DNA primase [Armatimonadota bacterium]
MDSLSLLRETVPPPGAVLFDSADDRLHLTDSGNAVRFARTYGHDLRFCWPEGRWYVWTGHRWQADDRGQVQALAAELPRLMLRQASEIDDPDLRQAAVTYSLKSESERARKALVALAQSEAGIAILPHELDADPWLLNVQNGTLDLRTSELRPHRREDLVTKLCPVSYEPSARSKVWDEFLVTVTGGDQELQRFL